MFLLLLYAAVVLLGLPSIAHGVSTIHVSITTLLTITSCPATVKECPRSKLPPDQLSLLSRSRYSASVFQSMSWNHDNCLRTFGGYNGQQFCSTFMNSFCSDHATWPGHDIYCTRSMTSQTCSAIASSGIGFSSMYSQSEVLETTSSSLTTSTSMSSSNAPPTVSSTTQDNSSTTGSDEVLLSTSGSLMSSGVPNQSSQATSASSSESSSIPQSPVLSVTSSTAVSTPESLSQSSQIGSSVDTGISQIVPTSSGTTSSGILFSFTSTFTDNQGNPTTTVIQATFSESTSVVQPSSATESISGSSQPGSSASFSSTSVFTDSERIPTTTVIPATQSTSDTESTSGLSQSLLSPSLSFFSTAVLTDSQGSLTTTVIQVTQSVSGTESTPEISQSQSTPILSSEPSSPFTSVFTNSQESSATTVIQDTQSASDTGSIPGLSSPSSPLLSFPSTSVFTNEQGTPATTIIQVSQTSPLIQSIPQSAQSPPSLQTVTLVLSDPQGNPTTTITQLSQAPLPTASTQSASEISELPTTTSATSSAASLTSFIPSITTDGGPVCSPLPACIYPTVTAKPTTCSPFPNCLTTAIPETVQTELASYCDGTPLVECIFTKPNPTCETNFPECLKDGGIDPNICPGYPFPDCLFTVYDPVVTSVMTTLPPGATIRTSSNSNYSTNTWSSSTDSDGHTVFFPIIVGCRDCTDLLTIIDGVDYFFNTIFRFPPIPFPKFPKIPKLHFPCVFFCDKGNKHHKHQPPVYDEPNKENEENDETSTTSTFSSTSSCEAATASACTVFSTVKVDGTSTTTMTSTTCSAETKCSATGHSSTTATTTSSAPTQTAYHISAQKDAGMEVINAFTAKLKAETDPSTLFVCGNEVWTSSWTQYLHENQTEIYIKEPAVAGIMTLQKYNSVKVKLYRKRKFSESQPGSIGETLESSQNQTFVDVAQGWLRPRDAVPNHQKTTDANLKIVSQPKGVDMNSIGTYTYLTEDQPARVYVVDSGFDGTHPLYNDITRDSGTPEWIFAGEVDGATQKDPYLYVAPGTFTDSDEWTSHGTSIISRILGPELGVSKKAALTIVRVPQALPTAEEKEAFNLAGNSFEEPLLRNVVIEHALSLIFADVIAKGVPQKTVISMSLGPEDGWTTLPAVGTKLWDIYVHLKKLANLGVTICMASGNGGGYPDDQGNFLNSWRITNEYAKWAPDLPAIVTGGASKDYKYWDEGKYHPAFGFPNSGADVVAPAEDIKMAVAVAHGSYVVEDGATSASNAMTAGLVAYFLGTKSHWDQIVELSKQIAVPAGVNAWPLAVKEYVRRLSHQLRDPGEFNDPFLIYNGEIPLDMSGNPVCQGSATAGSNAKRQSGGSCARPNLQSSASIASASSASVASASSASLASLSSASLASLSSASLASVSSASASSTTTSALPTGTGTFSGYIGSTCYIGDTMVREDTVQLAARLCSRSYIWDTKGKPPRDVQGTASSDVGADFTRDGRDTFGGLYPSENIAPACGGGAYPRSLNQNECISAFARLLVECPTGGQMAWVTEDHNGCMGFTMAQVGPPKPPITLPPPPPVSTSEPPPEPTEPPPPPTSINNEKCFKSDQFEDQLAIAPGLAEAAIVEFCKRSYTWEHFNKPAQGEPGSDPHVIRRTYGGLDVSELRALAAPFIEGKSDEACRVNKYPRTLEPEVCAYAFRHLKDSTCKYGGSNIATSSDGCFVLELRNYQNFNW